jgi:glutathione S-transferase
MKLVASLTSPYARKIRVALAEKGLPFELEVDIPWLADTRVPDYNPSARCRRWWPTTASCGSTRR